jgi:hypothetical protein
MCLTTRTNHSAVKSGGLGALGIWHHRRRLSTGPRRLGYELPSFGYSAEDQDTQGDNEYHWRQQHQFNHKAAGIAFASQFFHPELRNS